MKIEHNMPFNEYLSAPGISSSQLKAAGGTSAAYWRYFEPRKPSRSMELGTLFHALFLEDKKQYAVSPDVDRRTKAGKSAWAEFVEQSEGIIVVTEKEASDIEAACSALRADANLMRYFDSGNPEVSVFDGIGKARCDWLGHDLDGDDLIIDLKTTQNAKPAAFLKTIANFEYHLQAAWYMRLTGVSQFMFLAVELTAPYEYSLTILDNESIEYANAVIEQRLERIAEFKAAGKENASSCCTGSEVKVLSLPTWAKY